jgi:hypothetical protein
VKIIEVDGGDGCVAPSAETVVDGSYPIARPLFIYVNNARADENPAPPSTCRSTPGPASAGSVKPTLEVLAGIPSVVLGYFAISFITPELLGASSDEVAFFNLLGGHRGRDPHAFPLVASCLGGCDARRPAGPAGGCVRARAVAQAHRSACVVFPAAVSGIVAALIIGSRGRSGRRWSSPSPRAPPVARSSALNVLQPGQTMTAAMAALGASAPTR